MHNFDNFQYDSCILKGVCSINPMAYSLQRVLVLFLILISKYALYLYKKAGIIDNVGKHLILNTLAITVFNPEFTENTFKMSVVKFKEILPNIIKKYESLSDAKDIKVNLEELELYKESDNIIKAIQYGEKSLLNRQKASLKTISLFQLMLVIAKSISINLMDLETFNTKFDKGFVTILEMLSLIENIDTNNDIFISKIKEGTKIDCEIMKLLRLAQEENYGKQKEKNVAYTTTPAKVVLVVGSNIKELEIILEALKDTDIEVYTHDDMMLAHTFPKFETYTNLKGHYGYGIENCLIDFATFPGPIILTKHSLHNIDNFYRGRLFTTDYTSPKGIIKINNNDFSEVVSSAQKSKGFKTGQIRPDAIVGCDYQSLTDKILTTFKNGNYRQIFLIGTGNISYGQKKYLKKLVKEIPEEVLIISFSYEYQKNNFIYVNNYFDSYGILYIFKELNKQEILTNIFFPKCDKSSISQMIYMKSYPNTNVLIGTCTPIMFNPSFIETLETSFGVQELTNIEDFFKDI